ncbi:MULTISPECIES: MDR family MFS transporter [Paenibacillus]|uniref:MDR family MFS transporter n=1 Tax=Paenibacillus TaxID=44249 RepID=UPI00020D7724|nr:MULTISPECIES: MDR family MFS transporter [Paenibacillus]EGL17854.1 drug resistance MFS transporter, drug:H+ antiporter-2 family [Paenibacillus sp. HGF7]EPD81692.1 drug:H+ antiporter-2 (14 Spanner) (DHA2) family drug resistance MFS transporter [Paenibacillus sp. HGH0039]MBV6715463.1 MFS transporter [Paenibacillus chitinolyticus]
MAKKNKAGLIIAALLLATLMASMDNTIVATAIGTIVGDLGGFDKLMWVTSAYMVAEMAGMPIFGKLSDMYGRKRFFIFGMIVFMIGSALCGTADSIIELSIYRAVQGIGGGALVPIAFTIMFDVVAPEKRGKIGGLFGAAYGISSIFGPLIGAYITDYINWSWIFYINLPVGIVAFFMIAFFYKESVEHTKQKIDYLGAVTLVASILCLMFALELGGKEYAWNSGMITGLFAAFAVLIVAFIFIERRAQEPILTFGMFKNRLYSTSNIMAVFSGAAFITASVYIPIFIQGVFGGTATSSGLVLLPMMVGSVITAAGGGFLLSKFTYRSIMIATLALLVAGMALLTTLTTGSSRFMVTILMILVGLGIGSSFSVLSNAAIHGFTAKQRGSASSTLSFTRELGMTLGITVFGIIQSHLFTNKLGAMFGSGGQTPENLNLSDPSKILTPETRGQIPAQILDKITEALSSSLVQTFAWAIIPAVIALMAAFFMSKEKFDPASELEEYTAPH